LKLNIFVLKKSAVAATASRAPPAEPANSKPAGGRPTAVESAEKDLRVYRAVPAASVLPAEVSPESQLKASTQNKCKIVFSSGTFSWNHRRLGSPQTVTVSAVRREHRRAGTVGPTDGLGGFPSCLN
jgi:hypothetical protein